MFLPQYSLRTMLLVMTVLAVCAWIVRLAVQGVPWAAGVSYAMLALVIMLVVWALTFVLVACAGVFFRRRKVEPPVTPGNPT
jgi:hypothetical protein